MGNSVSNDKKQACRSQPSVSSCFGCLVANNNHDGFDSTELKIGLDGFKPRGKITEQSIAYLNTDEINFFKAASGRNVSLIRFYLSKNININILDEERTSPLHVAARHGSIQVVEELINSGANLNITDMAGWTRKQITTLYFKKHFMYQVCEILLKAGGDFTIRNRENNLPQDLVRDKMTQEKFKIHASQVQNGYSNEQVAEMSFAFDKQKLQREIAKEQFQDYFKNLKKTKLTCSAVREGGSRLPESRNISGNNTPLKQRVNKENQEFNKSNVELESESVSYHLVRQKSSHSKMVSEVPQEDQEKERIFHYSPSQSQKSVFFKEVAQTSLGELVETQNDKQLGVFESSSRQVHDFAVALMNCQSQLGLAYLLLSSKVKPTVWSVAQFLFKEDSTKLNISEQKIFQLYKRVLTNCIIKESFEILSQYVESYAFQNRDYLGCLRDFFGRLHCENDPWKLDMVVSVLSERIFHIRSKKKTNAGQFPFKSSDALHMFTFAVVILDIEINLNKGKANSKKLEVAVQDFAFHIQSVNDGENFDQAFINDIIDDVRKTKIISLYISEELHEQDHQLSQVRGCLLELSSVGSIKLLKKKGKEEAPLQFEAFVIGNHLILLGAEENRLKVVPRQTVRFSCSNKRELVMQPKLGFHFLQVASSKQFSRFKVKEQTNLKYSLGNQADFLKLDALNV